MYDLYKNAEASALKGMKESLLIIKTTDSQTRVKQFKSFRFQEYEEYKRETKSSLGLNFW